MTPRRCNLAPWRSKALRAAPWLGKRLHLRGRNRRRRRLQRFISRRRARIHNHSCMAILACVARRSRLRHLGRGHLSKPPCLCALQARRRWRGAWSRRTSRRMSSPASFAAPHRECAARLTRSVQLQRAMSRVSSLLRVCYINARCPCCVPAVRGLYPWIPNWWCSTLPPLCPRYVSAAPPPCPRSAPAAGAQQTSGSGTDGAYRLRRRFS